MVEVVVLPYVHHPVQHAAGLREEEPEEGRRICARLEGIAAGELQVLGQVVGVQARVQAVVPDDDGTNMMPCSPTLLAQTDSTRAIWTV